jgi:hypothetical protein
MAVTTLAKGGLTDLFATSAVGYSRSPTNSLNSSFPGQDAQEVRQDQSMLAALTGGQLDTSVSTVPVDNYKVDVSRGNAADQIGVNRQALDVVKTDVADMKSKISNVVDGAQREVFAVMKEMNADPAIFMDRRMASSPVEIAANAATSGSTMAIMDLVYADVRGKSGADEVLAKIEDQLRSYSAPSVQGQEGYRTQQQQQAPDQGDFNWNEFFDNGHELADLMAFDPDKPEQLPEWAELDNLDIAIAGVEENLDLAEDREEVDYGFSMYMVTTSLSEASGLQVSGVRDMNAEEVTGLLASLRNEPDPRMLDNTRQVSFSSTFG